MKRRALITVFVLMLAVPRPAAAVNRDVRAVLVASEYGALAGTVLGAASLPFSQNVRSVFLGTSVGLYLGIAVGIYYVLNRDNPENPLGSHQRYGASNSTEGGFAPQGWSEATLRPTPYRIQPCTELSLPIARF